MNENSLERKLRTRTARIAIIGLGYAGLPMAVGRDGIGVPVFGRGHCESSCRYSVARRRKMRIHRHYSHAHGGQRLRGAVAALFLIGTMSGPGIQRPIACAAPNNK